MIIKEKLVKKLSIFFYILFFIKFRLFWIIMNIYLWYLFVVGDIVSNFGNVMDEFMRY